MFREVVEVAGGPPMNMPSSDPWRDLRQHSLKGTRHDPPRCARLDGLPAKPGDGDTKDLGLCSTSSAACLERSGTPDAGMPTKRIRTGRGAQVSRNVTPTGVLSGVPSASRAGNSARVGAPRRSRPLVLRASALFVGG